MKIYAGIFKSHSRSCSRSTCKPGSGFYKTEERILKKVRNRNLVNADLLPTPSEVKEFYSNAGIPEEKFNVISKNYEIKLQLFSEFQKGKTILLYAERRK